MVRPSRPSGPSTPRRILILNERDSAHPSAGGAEVHVDEISKRLAARGYDITLLSSRFSGAPPVDEIAGMHVRRLAGLSTYYPRAAWTCWQETRQGRYDVVVEHLCKLPHLSPRYAAVPVVAVCHHLFGRAAFMQVAWPIAATVWGVERLIPFAYRHALFVAVSQSTKDDLVARGVAAEHIRIVHNGINTPEHEPPSLAKRRRRVVYLGRLEPYKRIDVLLRAVARVVGRFPDLDVRVIGRGQSRPALEETARELGLATRTQFVGFVSDAERDRLLAEARVCVCPSVKEGWGLTVIEANAVGVPVIATDAPGLRDAVRDGDTGFLVPEGDVAAFAERIERLLADDALAARMSGAAAAWARNFTWDAAADGMERVLEEVVAARR
jgi:glycosyltransferase involved in cell wall biosynthesis